MRNMRRRALLAVMVVAAMTLGAAQAAADQLGVHQEFGPLCQGVSITFTDVNGGCLTHATSEGSIEVRKHVFGIESHITSCSNEFHMRLQTGAPGGANLSGYIFEQALTGANCTRRACHDPFLEPQPWTVTGTETDSPQGVFEGREYLTVNFCLEPIGGGTDETCEIDIPFQTYAFEHRQEYGHAGEMSSHGVTGFRCEVVGHWNSETGGVHSGWAEPIDGSPEQELEVTHLN